ncbi:uncharacterized protein LTR77_008152 [Saxophila tyrrhenica]|uniref:Uncharacterized protein n=1 Tax=Saxophila tyrrhenica TaxID=1690608 RepID=A0AAV9P2L5_9PEZI|nr:hypothetical protein LTR77_008152 [Saxophila tyrrhenica]
MVGIKTVRESNSKGKQLEGLVAVFVGGTGGIGESTAKEFFLRTTKPRAYIVGRSAERGNKIVRQLNQSNPGGAAFFIQKDVSVLRNVDELCVELKQRERKINSLVLTAGYMTLRGRTETEEGIDQKMSVNYYSRIRCILNLMPMLENASNAGELSRVITVLAAGSEGEVRLTDLELKQNFTLHACLAHCVVMTDFTIEELSRRYPGTAFSHSYPGTVKTGIANQLSGPVRLAVKVMYAVMSPWILDVQESGERHFFQMTSKCYPAARGGVGIEVPDGMSVFKGMDGVVGGGAYLLDWDGKTCGDESVLSKYRALDMGPQVWEHTMKVFARAEQHMRKDSKRPATEDAEGSARPIPNPIGWRAA